MVSEIRIYYEGSEFLKPGFRTFFTELAQRAQDRGCEFRLIHARSGSEASRDFGIALHANRAACNILLRDSEGPDDGKLSSLLCQQNDWDQSYVDSIFWMVEMMESWFHADKDALAVFYGNGFRNGALKANPEVERIPKRDLIAGLRAATKDSQKGNYYDHKTSHAPELLASIQPQLVRRAAPNCERLFQTVLAKLT